MPVFAVFFPVEIAIAQTAVVHLLNNLFKFLLLGKYTDKSIILWFGIPAIAASFFGASVLLWLSDLKPIFFYHLFDREMVVMPVKLAVAFLMISFAFIEIMPSFEHAALEKKFLPIGGLLSGFFGGLSGHQGALRSAFLIKCGLSKESFIGTGVVIACLVDMARLGVYSRHFAMSGIQGNGVLIVAATLSAFLGAWTGSRFLKKVTMRGVQILVSALLFLIALGLGSGLI